MFLVVDRSTSHNNLTSAGIYDSIRRAIVAMGEKPNIPMNIHEYAINGSLVDSKPLIRQRPVLIFNDILDFDKHCESLAMKREANSRNALWRESLKYLILHNDKQELNGLYVAKCLETFSRKYAIFSRKIEKPNIKTVYSGITDKYIFDESSNSFISVTLDEIVRKFTKFTK